MTDHNDASAGTSGERFDSTKPFKTRDGREVDVIEIRGESVFGRVKGEVYPQSRCSGWVNGRFPDYCDLELATDLVNVPPDTAHTVDGTPIAEGFFREGLTAREKSDAAPKTKAWRPESETSACGQLAWLMSQGSTFKPIIDYVSELESRAALARSATSPDAGGEAVAWQWCAGSQHEAIHGAGWQSAKSETKARELAERFAGEVRPLYAAPQPAADAWRAIESAPKDGTEIWVYAPPYDDLEAIQCRCAWHPDAGFCVDDLRQVTHWRPLPAPPGANPAATVDATTVSDLKNQRIRYAQFVDLWINRPNLTDAERVSVIKHRPKTKAFAEAIGAIPPGASPAAPVDAVATIEERRKQHAHQAETGSSAHRSKYTAKRVECEDILAALRSETR